MRVNFQPAFVLHTRLYRDTSLLVELFTEHYGRVSAVAKGVRVAKSKTKGLLLPFIPLALCWSGKSSLVNIGKVEALETAYNLSGHYLFSGFYLNELLLKLFQYNDPHPAVFHAYRNVMEAFRDCGGLQAILRLFEKQLLKELGFGLLFNQDSNGNEIIADAKYYYEHERGLVRSPVLDDATKCVSGKSLLALHHEDLTDLTILAEAKKIMRIIFDYLLDGKPLNSRKLFAEVIL